jgi:hypothetical protein
MRAQRVLVAAVLVLGAVIVSSCSAGRTNCDYAAPAVSFVGPLDSVRGATATFVVESTSTTEETTGPTPRVGQHVDVRYENDEQHFLRVGRRYAVTAWRGNDGLVSGVHHSDDPCSTGTWYADGKPINTSLWLHPAFRRWVVVVALLPVVALLLVTWFAWRRRRPRRSGIMRTR